MTRIRRFPVPSPLVLMPLSRARLIPLVPPITEDEFMQPFRGAAESAFGASFGGRVDHSDSTGFHVF